MQRILQLASVSLTTGCLVAVCMTVLVPHSVSAQEEESRATDENAASFMDAQEDLLDATDSQFTSRSREFSNDAQTSEFVPLAGLPGLTDNTQSRTLADYINVLFRLAIGLGALAAVIRITIAGIKYMGDDSFSSKQSAKEDIKNSLLGILILLSTFIILYLINPNILNLNILQSLQPPRTAQVPTSSGPVAAPVSVAPPSPSETEDCGTPDATGQVGQMIYHGNKFTCIRTAPETDPSPLEEYAERSAENALLVAQIKEKMVRIKPTDSVDAQAITKLILNSAQAQAPGKTIVFLIEPDSGDLQQNVLRTACTDINGEVVRGFRHERIPYELCVKTPLE